CILEQQVDLDREVSIVLARTADGKMVHYPIAENEHREGVLAVSTIPANINDRLSAEAISMAHQIATALDYCGVLAVEYFIARSGELLVNEIAPRPHNSGHFTLDACVSSQFDQQLRTLCGLPLGDPRLLSPVSMVNLLGDRWLQSENIQWLRLFEVPGACLHLYGKQEARPKRKMGHFCVLAETPEAAEKHARALDIALSPSLSAQV
ncbi:ATP-grasp domain-containing protein, partial [Acidihalobacter prosperus]